MLALPFSVKDVIILFANIVILGLFTGVLSVAISIWVLLLLIVIVVFKEVRVATTLFTVCVRDGVRVESAI